MPGLKSEQSEQQFNNADSFSMAFDEAWKHHSFHNPSHGLTASEKKVLILETCRDHPFMAGNPETAAQIAEFRIRLLKL